MHTALVTFIEEAGNPFERDFYPSEQVLPLSNAIFKSHQGCDSIFLAIGHGGRTSFFLNFCSWVRTTINFLTIFSTQTVTSICSQPTAEKGQALVGQNEVTFTRQPP
jgi:hypothetical protein